jgi:hypothetical protein
MAYILLAQVFIPQEYLVRVNFYDVLSLSYFSSATTLTNVKLKVSGGIIVPISNDRLQLN